MIKLDEIAIGFANRAQRDTRALLRAKLALINSMALVIIAALPQVQSVELALLALPLFIIGLNQIERAGFIALLEACDSNPEGNSVSNSQSLQKDRGVRD